MHSDPAARASTAANRFGFDLLARLGGDRLEKNIFISPYGISAALTMAWSGARGATARDMARALRLDGETAAALTAAGALRSQLRSDTAVTLEIANSLWLDRNFPLQQPFRDLVRQRFDARTTALDFSDPASAAAINDWVGQATHGRIAKIIDRIPPDMRLYLINAVYFKGVWQVRFDPAATRDQDFYPLSGPAAPRPLMHQSGHYRYLKGGNFQAVKLPYRGGTAAMYVFLPDRRDGVTAVLKRLTAANWSLWTAAMERRRGELALPRFRIEYESELSRPLAKLGMARAFGDRADFSGISRAGLAISEVRHKTFLEVNEEGTEAAAATAVGMRTTSVVIEPPPFAMTVDHPFVLAVADLATGAILFLGVITDLD